MKQPFILYHPRTRPTGRALARELGISYGKKCRGKRCKGVSHVIRWGNAEEVPRLYAESGRFWPRTFLNSRQAVANASGKYRALQLLQEAGVPVPAFTRNYHPTVQEWIEAGDKVLARRFRHMQGRDIVILTGSDGWLVTLHGAEVDHDYYVKYIEPHKEYRIHVFQGQILFAQKKYFGQELYDKLAEEVRARYGKTALENWELDTEYIRNNEHGWRFYDMTDVNNVPSAVKSASVSAVDALGLDFGAVDVISYGRDENGSRRASVLEINTGPGLRGRNLTKYAEAIRTWLTSR